MGNIDYSSLVLKTETTTEKPEVKKAPAKPKKKPTFEYIVEGVSGCDCVITRVTPKTKVQLVVLVSQGQCYTKDLITNTITQIEDEVDLLNVFFDKLKLDEEIKVIDKDGNKLTWLNSFKKNARANNVLSEIITDEKYRELLKHGYIYIDYSLGAFNYIDTTSKIPSVKYLDMINKLLPTDEDRTMLRMGLTSDLFRLYYDSGTGYNYKRYNKIRSLAKYFTASETYYDYQAREYVNRPYSEWELKYGISGLRQAIQACLESSVEVFPNKSEMHNLFVGNARHNHKLGKEANITFDLQSLIQYIFYSSVEQGYADDIPHFFQTWTDVLNMEYLIYGKYVDKYPEHLASYHQLLTYKYNLIEAEIDARLWEENSAVWAQFEDDSMEDYTILAPKEPHDMVDEATQQSNCLSSYVDSVTRGATMIFFLRKKEDLEKSLVTIEVRDGELRQVKAKYNREPSDEQLKIVHDWFDRKFTQVKPEVA